jgi:hypothetical protein
MRFAVVPYALAAACTVGGCHRKEAPPPPPTPGATTSAAPPLDSGDPSVLSSSSDSSSQLEPHLAVSGDGVVVVAWMAARPGLPAVIGARFSRDGGKTWGPVQTLAAPGGRASADPTLAADPRGNVYLAWLGFTPDVTGGPPRDAHVYVARTESEGRTFGAPVDVSQGTRRGASVDKPWITITSAGAAVVAWSYTSAEGNGIAVARSPNGVDWAKSIVVDRTGLHASLPFVCAPRRGDRVWLAYLDDDGGVRLYTSDDGGVTWPSSRAVTVSTAAEREHVAADSPTCAGEEDDVAVAFGHTKDVRDGARSPGLDSIVLVRSFDGGRTFDWRRTLDTSDGLAMHPEILREPDGALDVVYYAGPAGAPDTASPAGAVRWARVPHSDAPLTAPRTGREPVRFVRERRDTAWPGDYFGVAWRSNELLVTTIDATSGPAHVALWTVPTSGADAAK